MPRGVKRVIDYDEEIAKVDARIVHHTNSIAELKEKRAALMEEKQRANMSTIYDYMQKNGLSPDELLERISKLSNS